MARWTKRTLRTDREFRNFGNRVLVYEVTELLNSLNLLSTQDFTRASVLRYRNALVESAAIHSRNIIEFLYFTKSKRHPGDVRATDYGVDWTTKWRHDSTALLPTLYRRASKQVGHVTAGRLGVRTREKRYSRRATRLLLREFRRFVFEAQQGPHSGRVGQHLDDIAKVLQDIIA